MIHLYVETVLPVLNYQYEFKELTLQKTKMRRLYILEGIKLRKMVKQRVQ